MPTQSNDTNRPSGHPVKAMLALAAVCAFVWLMTHDACSHPVGNTMAMIVLVGASVILVLPHAVDWACRYLDIPDETEVTE